MDDKGMVRVLSSHGFKETVELLTTAIRDNGLHMVAQFDHAEAARHFDLTLRPTVVLVFGNPKSGTPLMSTNQEVGIDLPLKFLVWEDSFGLTHVSYQRPAWIAERHDLDGVDAILDAMGSVLLRVVRSATSSNTAEGSL